MVHFGLEVSVVQNILSPKFIKIFELYQVFMCHLYFPIYISFMKRIDTFWPVVLAHFWYKKLIKLIKIFGLNQVFVYSTLWEKLPILPSCILCKLKALLSKNWFYFIFSYLLTSIYLFLVLIHYTMLPINIFADKIYHHL